MDFGNFSSLFSTLGGGFLEGISSPEIPIFGINDPISLKSGGVFSSLGNGLIREGQILSDLMQPSSKKITLSDFSDVGKRYMTITLIDKTTGETICSEDDGVDDGKEIITSDVEKYIKLHDHMNNDYEKGYSDGYDIGYSEGSDDSFDEGYEAGYADGYSDGETYN